MIAKTITYTDFDGNERTETFHFNLTKAELIDLETSTDGGLEKKIEKIIASKDTKEIMNMFKDIILKSYGVKSDDGKRMIKTPEVVQEFTQTEAYSELFIELATDADAATAFINGIIPAKLLEEAKKQASITPISATN